MPRFGKQKVKLGRYRVVTHFENESLPATDIVMQSFARRRDQLIFGKPTGTVKERCPGILHIPPYTALSLDRATVHAENVVIGKGPLLGQVGSKCRTTAVFRTFSELSARAGYC